MAFPLSRNVRFGFGSRDPLSAVTVFTGWEIGHDPDTKGDNDDARTGSAQLVRRYEQQGRVGLISRLRDR